MEAAGGAGLQLFVDSNTEVDSALIRHLVSEVLTETVSLLLGQRDSMRPEPEPEAAAVNELRDSSSVCLCSDLKHDHASVPGEPGSTGPHSSANTSTQSERDHAPDHTPSLCANQPDR